MSEHARTIALRPHTPDEIVFRQQFHRRPQVVIHKRQHIQLQLPWTPLKSPLPIALRPQTAKRQHWTHPRPLTLQLLKLLVPRKYRFDRANPRHLSNPSLPFPHPHQFRSHIADLIFDRYLRQIHWRYSTNKT